MFRPLQPIDATRPEAWRATVAPRRSASERGTVIILVVAVLALMVILGAAYLRSASSNSRAARTVLLIRKLVKPHSERQRSPSARRIRAGMATPMSSECNAADGLLWRSLRASLCRAIRGVARS